MLACTARANAAERLCKLEDVSGTADAILGQAQPAELDTLADTFAAWNTLDNMQAEPTRPAVLMGIYSASVRKQNG
jgi:hypothetical protein